MKMIRRATEKFLNKFFVFYTYPNWFCKTGYAVLRPAAAAAANGKPEKDEKEIF